MSATAEAGLEALLDFMQQQRGFDFTGYKRPSLVRRILRRMQVVQVGTFEEYRDYLDVHPDEFAQLFNTILINVTSFFRDPESWELLSRDVLPALLAEKGPRDAVRIWSAGCASGQEAYTIGVVLAELMGAEGFRERVKIYATDADEEALAQARLGSYTAKDMESMPPALRDAYFEAVEGRFVFRADLRRAVIFGRHDLVQDAPISRLDMLVCRNTLMYFNAATQARVMSRFHFALNGAQRGGILFLGRAEMMLTHGTLFQPIDLRRRVFAKVVSPAARARGPVPPVVDNGSGADMTPNQRLRELALEESPVARIVVDTDGRLALANQRARTFFSITLKDLGRPLQDLEISYRPVELRSLIEQSYAERRTVTHPSVERRYAGGEVQYLDISVQPIFDETQRTLGVGINFLDVTRYCKLQEELQRSREEIQTTSEELQSSNEELETTNEELQSSNEELETTNEELQSTNEELETMNEELQSTNEELQTVNEELRQRTDEMHNLNAFLQSVLGSLSAGAVVVNRNLDVLVWNKRAEDLWGLREDEVKGKSLLNLDIGLPVGELRAPVKSCLMGESDHKQLILAATNRRGKAIKCRVTCTPLLAGGKQRDGVILMMEEAG